MVAAEPFATLLPQILLRVAPLHFHRFGVRPDRHLRLARSSAAATLEPRRSIA
jgi:hypothetical protein